MSKPAGTDIAGSPARLAEIVAISVRYIASGSSVFAPKSNAVFGQVGAISASTCANAFKKSSVTTLLICNAFL